MVKIRQEHFYFDAIPDAKPAATFAGMALEFIE